MGPESHEDRETMNVEVYFKPLQSALPLFIPVNTQTQTHGLSLLRLFIVVVISILRK